MSPIRASEMIPHSIYVYLNIYVYVNVVFVYIVLNNHIKYRNSNQSLKEQVILKNNKLNCDL